MAQNNVDNSLENDINNDQQPLQQAISEPSDYNDELMPQNYVDDNNNSLANEINNDQQPFQEFELSDDSDEPMDDEPMAQHTAEDDTLNDDIHQHYSPCVNSHEKTLQPHNIFMAQRAVQMQNMLNKRIQVQFNKEAEVLEEFEGYVTSVHLFNGSFTVHFDDGDVWTLDVKAVDYKLLDDHVFTLSEITTSMKHSKIKVTPKDVCLEVMQWSHQNNRHLSISSFLNSAAESACNKHL
eukprot:527715_1